LGKQRAAQYAIQAIWNKITFRIASEYEPELRELERQADDFHRGGGRWADFWLGTQPRLTRLVGFLAERPGLRSMRAYNTVVKHLTTVWAVGLEPPPAMPDLAELERLSRPVDHVLV
jgi:hypothetical protein